MRGWLFWALVPVLLQEDEAARAAIQGWRHPWAGFRAGSRLVINETTRRSHFDLERKQTVFRDQWTQYVWTVRSATPEAVVVRMEGGGKESEIPIPLAPPGIFRGRGQAKGGENLDVGGRIYRCAVFTISLDMDRDAGQRTTIWRCPEAPVWAVRILSETFAGGKRNTWEEERLVETGKNLEIEGREVSCHVFEVTTESEGGGRTVNREWRCEAIPGGVARRETRLYEGGRENEGAYRKMEVVSFEARR